MAITVGVLSCIAYCLTPFLYDASFRIIIACFTAVFPRCCREAWRSQDGDNSLSLGGEEVTKKPDERWRASSAAWARAKLTAVIGMLLVLHIVRPRVPFNHMTATLPFTMLDVVFDSRSPVCNPSPRDRPKRFPFPHLVREDFWIPPTTGEGGNSRGWNPGRTWPHIIREKPPWLPKEEVPGFAKWYRGSSFMPPLPPPAPPGFAGDSHPPRHGPPHPPGYESVLDPLKISNFDQPLLDAVRSSLLEDKSGTGIKHVIVMTLESTRKDVFPLIKDGPLYEDLEKSWGKGAGERMLADLSQLSVNAQVLTGEDTGFAREVNQTHGGVNVLGAMTTSTYTLKSLLSSHCGVNPLPVDFLEDIETEIYQPCLPQILKVMNAQDKSDSGENSWRQAPWRSVFAQASTSALDRQTELMERLGFDQFIDRETLQNPASEFSVKGPELNYFGYSERELKPLIRKTISEAEDKGERLFLSHLTSSTHHPWATPEEFGEQENYWGDSRAGDSPWNRYLNTIKFADQWGRGSLGSPPRARSS